MGKTCGRRKRRSRLVLVYFPLRRTGTEGERERWKAPGSQEASFLRGSVEQCEPRSVRHACKGLVPGQSNAPTTRGVLWKYEEGNVVGVR
jgi:hypothetical protein